MPIDLLCFLALGYGFWTGYQRGIIQVVFNVIAYVFGVTLAFKMTPTTSDLLETAFKSHNPLMFLAGFLVNLAVLMILIRYAAKGMEGLFQAAYMGTINQLFGGIAYGSFFLLIFSILVWFANKALMISDETRNESKTYIYLEPLPAKAREYAVRLQPVFSEIWQTSITWMDRMKNYGPKNKDKKPEIYNIPEDGSTSPIEDAPEEVKPRPKTTPPVDDGNGIEENE